MSFADENEKVDSEMSPTSGSRGFLAVLWQRKALVILGAVVGIAGGVLFYLNRAPVYQSSTQILIIKRRVEPMQGGLHPGMGVYEDYMATHMQFLRNPGIIERAVKNRDLTSLKTFENCGGDATAAVHVILGGLTVTRDNKDVLQGTNNILIVAFRGPVADECGKVITAIIDSYKEELDSAYHDASAESENFFRKASEQLLKQLKAAELEQQKFRESNDAFSYATLKDGMNIQLEKMAAIERKRSDLKIQETELRELIAMLQKAIKDGQEKDVLEKIAEKKTTAPEKTLNDTLLPLKLEELELQTLYGDNHPRVINVRNRMKVIRDHFQSLIDEEKNSGKLTPGQRQLASWERDLRHTEVTLRVLTHELDLLKGETKAQSKNENKENYLKKDIERLDQLYNATLKRLTEISVSKSSSVFNARMLTPPGMGYQVAPIAYQMIVAGLMLGLLLGTGLAYLADLTDKSFRNPDEVRRRMALPVLGHIPFLKPDEEVARRVSAGEVLVDPLLYTLFRPKSMEAEAYRAIRTALFFSTQGEGHKVLQVTSPNKGDGKTLMLSNLAISMAQSGKKILVIDADCRRPRQHKVFHLPNTDGLTTVISKGALWKEVVHTTPVDGLWIMPSGPIPPNPSELLSSPQFKDLLSTVRAEFDYVLVDTAPLLAVTDPCVVAGLVDGLVLIIRLSRHGRPHAERARSILVSLGVNILGVVVNGVVRQGGAGMYGYEHYDYTDSYEDTDKSDTEDGYYYQDDEEEIAGVPAKK